METDLNKKKVLLVDDDDSIRWVLNEVLVEMNLQVIECDNVEDALALLHHSSFDLLISDIRMPGRSGIDLLRDCQKNYPLLPVIVMTAHSDLDSAVKAYTQGAFEYLPKPFDLDEMSETIVRALTLSNSEENEQAASASHPFSIIGEAPSMQNLYRAIGRLSRSLVSVLITGESGTGKELIAHALHQHSPRKNQVFIALNMAAIPKDLIESELFGHEKGAFTGATKRTIGRFEQADQGTLFLDEIGDMPIDTQTRLLRVLSEGTFYRIGSHQPTSVNVRIIAATHQNLLEKTKAGEFREDLYHRLNVIPLRLPPLRERTEDIPLLADFFLNNIAKELTEKKIALSKSALEKMKKFNWPGNVRQLENVCRWLSVMANGRLIMAADLPDELSNTAIKNTDPEWKKQLTNQINNHFSDGNDTILIDIQAEFEQLLIKTALAMSAGKKAQAANYLGWGRNTLARKQK